MEQILAVFLSKSSEIPNESSANGAKTFEFARRDQPIITKFCCLGCSDDRVITSGNFERFVRVLIGYAVFVIFRRNK